jgi:hypothetical protein
MPKILGAKEKRHQPFWDTLIRGTAPATWTPRQDTALASSPIRLFSSATSGNFAVTNMDGPGGQFPSDQTYRILAMRVWLYFRGCGGGGLNDFIMYHRASTQLFWELEVAGKQAFICPTPYLPMGGGLFGDVGGDTNVYFNNGVPSQEAIMKLGRAISLPMRQNFVVKCTIAALGAQNFATDMTTITQGEVHISYFIDGLHVRDIL